MVVIDSTSNGKRQTSDQARYRRNYFTVASDGNKSSLSELLYCHKWQQTEVASAAAAIIRDNGDIDSGQHGIDCDHITFGSFQI